MIRTDYVILDTTRHEHSSNEFECQRINRLQAEGALQTAPIGSWIHRESSHENCTALSVKMADAEYRHILVQSDNDVWYKIDPNDYHRHQPYPTFEAFLLQHNSDPALQKIYRAGQDAITHYPHGADYRASPHFHSLSCPEAEKALIQSSPGTFLFRPSKLNGHITVSYVKNGGGIRHIRLKVDHNFHLQPENQPHLYTSIEHFIDRHPSTLTTPYCPPILKDKTDNELASEFQALPRNFSLKDCTIARSHKNRFQDVLPYDRNAFLIDGFYYNASYLFEGKALAAQGPTQEQQDDFWMMVWKSNSRCLVMLTRTEECCRYWPGQGEAVKRGPIQIAGIEEQQNGNLTTRQLKAAFGGEERVIYHYHYTGWQDNGTAPPQEMAGLVKLLEGQYTRENPLIAHCKGGIGRTGTLLALLFSYQKVQEGQRGDLYFQTAREVRKGRGGSIQTQGQYISGYRALESLSQEVQGSAQDIASSDDPH